MKTIHYKHLPITDPKAIELSGNLIRKEGKKKTINLFSPPYRPRLIMPNKLLHEEQFPIPGKLAR